MFDECQILMTMYLQVIGSRIYDLYVTVIFTNSLPLLLLLSLFMLFICLFTYCNIGSSLPEWGLTI